MQGGGGAKGGGIRKRQSDTSGHGCGIEILRQVAMRGWGQGLGARQEPKDWRQRSQAGTPHS